MMLRTRGQIGTKSRTTGSPETNRRRGGALVLIVLLLTVFMVCVAFSVDLARVQLAQLELQSTADLSARAGAEAIARGVGSPTDNNVTDTAIRDEIAMVAELNRAGGAQVNLTNSSDISFGYGTVGSGFTPSSGGGVFDSLTDAVRVKPQLANFNMFFATFIGSNTVDLSKQAAAVVQERDIVVVLDRSTSMLDHDAGTMSQSAYLTNLRLLEDDIYGSGDSYYTSDPDDDFNHTEWDIDGSTIRLSKIQALKLAVFKFRQAIDLSRGHEQLGLVSYSTYADTPAMAATTANPVDIVAGLAPSVRSAIVGTGVTTENERFASPLESHSVSYKNFDYNYLAIRWRPGTNISDGIIKGADVLFGPGRRQFARPILVLMTDGNHNQHGSGTPQDALATVLSSHPDMTLYTISFGASADTTLMSNLATTGGGKWYHANNVSTLVSAFEEIARTAGVTLIE